MILHKLNELYERMESDSFYENLAPFGYSLQKIAAAIIINRQGQLVQIQDLRHSAVDAKGKSKILPHFELVCGQSKPSGSGLNPCFLWDNAMYSLGVNLQPEESKKKSPLDYFEAFKEKHLALESSISHPDYQALCLFLRQWQPDQLSEEDFKQLQDMGSPFLVFKLLDGSNFIHTLPEIKNFWETVNEESSSDKIQGTCLVSGKTGAIATLHEPPIKGVPGSQASGAKLVSFNSNAFCSYGLKQGANAPVSESIVFRYANALNTLLQYSKHHVRLNGEVLAFWTEKPCLFEDSISSLFFEPDEFQITQDGGKLAEIKNYFSNIRNHGDDDLSESKTKFYILGIAPNASRLSVRLWLETSVGNVTQHLKRFFDELRLDDSMVGRPVITIRRILSQAVRELKNISAQDEISLLRVALMGAKYEPKLIINILKRIHAECASSDPKINKYAINFYRACILKAFLLRNYNHYKTNINLMSLDTNCTNKGYLLGRLFAVMEKIQERALGNVNASIRDKYYTTASTTPRAVFPILERKMMKHLKKLPNAGYYEMLISEILDHLSAESGYPIILSLEDRSFFTLGYYHQRQEFFKKPEAPASQEASQTL